MEPKPRGASFSALQRLSASRKGGRGGPRTQPVPGNQETTGRRRHTRGPGMELLRRDLRNHGTLQRFGSGVGEHGAAVYVPTPFYGFRPQNVGVRGGSGSPAVAPPP